MNQSTIIYDDVAFTFKQLALVFINLDDQSLATMNSSNQHSWLYAQTCVIFLTPSQDHILMNKEDSIFLYNGRNVHSSNGHLAKSQNKVRIYEILLRMHRFR